MLQYELFENRSIIYVDESGFSVGEIRDKGYSFKGTRCYGVKNWNEKGRVNAIGAIKQDFNLLTVCLFDGTINADVFYSWVTLDFLPKVSKGSVIVMDNASFHKRDDCKEAIEKHDCILEFLPPYSPDLNPIEKKWAQAKNLRKKLRCTPYELFENQSLYDKLL